MSLIVTIQFITAGKLYDFDAGAIELVQGDRVVVETERGLGIGQIVRHPREKGTDDGSLLTIKRKATDDDMAALERIHQKEQEAYRFCVNRIVERSMPMKLVRVEYQFDGSKAVFYFTADGRVDFRDLVKDLAHTFHTRIEMRQIGVRDEAKMIGGIGICGRELCCSSWLRDFQPVSVKMAKEQKPGPQSQQDLRTVRASALLPRLRIRNLLLPAQELSQVRQTGPYRQCRRRSRQDQYPDRKHHAQT